MRTRTAIFFVTILCAAGVVGAQENRLGDVAGAIKLDPTGLRKLDAADRYAPEAQRPDAAILKEALDAFSAEASRLADLVTEARASVRLYSSDLPDQLVEAALDLEAVLQDLQSLRLADRMRPPLATALKGADICDVAGKGVRRTIANTWIAFTDEVALLAECRRLLDDAEKQVAALEGQPVEDQTDRGATPPAQAPAQPLSADEIIESLCEAQRAAGAEEVEDCTGRQYRALAALDARTAAIERLDDAAFAEIRRLCAEQSPADFVARDVCEQDRMILIREE